MQETLKKVLDDILKSIANHNKAFKKTVEVLKSLEDRVKKLEKDVARLYVGSGKTRSE